MKFLTGLLRFFKFRKNEDGVELTKSTKTAERAGSASKSRRFKTVLATALAALLIVSGIGVWGFFSPEKITPKNASAVWVPVSEADKALFQAVRGGDAQEVRSRLLEGGDGHAADSLGVTPFKAAVALGRVDIVREFLEDARVASPEKLTPLLIYAVIQNRPQVVRELLKMPLDLNAQDRNGFTPLLYAIERSYTAVVKELLDAGADVNARGRDGSTPLIAAVTRGKHDIVAELLRAGADWKIPSPSGETAIDIARDRNREIIVALLTEGSTPSEAVIE